MKKKLIYLALPIMLGSLSIISCGNDENNDNPLIVKRTFNLSIDAPESLKDDLVIAAPDNGEYLFGTSISVSISYSDSTNYAFDGYFVNGTKKTDNLSYTFKLTEDTNLVAKFTQIGSINTKPNFFHKNFEETTIGEVVEVGQAVGIMAAQSIGEPGTQLTMRTFHTGGVAGSDITQGLPRVQELFEARNPKGQAIISEIKGKVTDIVSDKGLHKITVKNEETGESVSYDTTYGAKLRVNVGDVVDNGQKLTEGAISPKELLQAAGIKAVEKYIVKEIHKVYFAQEIDISDKHIEIIVKQMLRKVYISDAGDTNLLPGGRVSIQEFEAENAKAIENNLRPAVAAPLILGITKAALESDSWLSAASFQETTRILTDAAIKGKVDPLHGLKENVITGRLIPAGRGLLNEEQEDSLMENFDVEGALESVEDQYRSNFEFQERENKEIMNQNK